MPSSPASPRARAGLLCAAASAALLFMLAWTGLTTPAVASSALAPAQDLRVDETPLPGAGVDIAPGAPMTVSLFFDKAGPGQAYPGTTLVYYLSVRNLGTTNAAVVITDTLDTRVTWQSTQRATGVSCTNGVIGGVITCTLASLAPSSAVLQAVTITVQINSGVGAGNSLTNIGQAKAAGDPAGQLTDIVRTDIIAAPTSTPTPTGGAPAPDAAECNNDFDHAYRISAAQTLPTLNFVAPPANSCGPLPVSGPDVDYFVVRAKSGDWYDAATSNLSAGIDTYMRLYDSSRNLVAENDDGTAGSFASDILWRAAYDGDYYVQITNLDPNNPRGATYQFKVTPLTTSPTAAPTKTPVPGPTTVPGLDNCEINWDFDHACTVAPGAALTGMNFISAAPGEPDNDFYQLWQKPGLSYSCQTDNLAAGMDTNIIVYDANRNGMMGNDDCTPGSFNSCVKWVSTYTGWVYFLVGSVVQPPPSTSTYEFRCDVLQPTATPTATLSPTPGLPPTVWFPSPTAPPPPVATTPSAPPPTPVPPPTATPPMAVFPLPTPTRSTNTQIIRVDVRVFYDVNGNSAPDPGEGVVAMRAQLVDAAGNVLDSRLTGANGQVQLTAVAAGDVFLEIPYLNVRVIVAGPRSSVDVRIVPQPVPVNIP